MVLMNLANYAQFEREMISERTQGTLRPHEVARECGWVQRLTDTHSATKWMQNGRRLLVCRFLKNGSHPEDQESARRRTFLSPRLRRLNDVADTGSTRRNMEK